VVEDDDLLLPTENGGTGDTQWPLLEGDNASRCLGAIVVHPLSQ